MPLFKVWNRAYKTAVFAAETPEGAVAAAIESGHMRKGYPRKVAQVDDENDNEIGDENDDQAQQSA